jgi:carbamoyltransferase
MLILSVHLGHDSSICVLNNGNLEQYFLVERYTRKKHDDNQSTILVLLNDICSKLTEPLDVISISNFNTKDAIILEIFEECRKYNSNVKLILQQEHHLNHASLAFYNSGFDKSLVVVVDGAGSTINDNLVEVESVFLFDQEKNTLIYKNIIEDSNPFDLFWEDSTFGVGKLYDIAAILIGNTPDDCGKVMGLSSYGSPNQLFKNLFLEKNIFNTHFFKNSSQEIKQFLKTPIRKIDSENYKLHADFCYEVQHQTQKVVGDIIEDSIIKTGIKKVCISGGYGMNIVANYYYLQRFPDVEFYFEPLCNDNGISIGAAMNSYFQLTNKIPNPLQTTSFHGSTHEISLYKGKTTSIETIVNLLNQNKSIAVYSGLAEAGQRALGNRSIFFNPLNLNAKDIVNKIKKREWYRPFACVVLEEDVNVYFDMGNVKSSRFMTTCFPVRRECVKIMPGITHVDNTCRVQTVSKTDGYLYKLLQEFKKLSGHGILLNTSFNLAGEPLVETPTDALNTLNNSSLDYLWFEETQQLLSR